MKKALFALAAFATVTSGESSLRGGFTDETEEIGGWRNRAGRVVANGAALFIDGLRPVGPRYNMPTYNPAPIHRPYDALEDDDDDDMDEWDESVGRTRCKEGSKPGWFHGCEIEYVKPKYTFCPFPNNACLGIRI